MASRRPCPAPARPLVFASSLKSKHLFRFEKDEQRSERALPLAVRASDAQLARTSGGPSFWFFLPWCDFRTTPINTPTPRVGPDPLIRPPAGHKATSVQRGHVRLRRRGRRPRRPANVGNHPVLRRHEGMAPYAGVGAIYRRRRRGESTERGTRGGRRAPGGGRKHADDNVFHDPLRRRPEGVLSRGFRKTAYFGA